MDAPPVELDDDEALLQRLEEILFPGGVPPLSPAVPWDPMGWRVED